MKHLSYILMLATLLVSCSDFGEEAVACVSIDGKWGYVDSKGEFVIDPQFDDAADFSEGLARVKIGGTSRYSDGGKWGYINPKGEFVINPQFDEVGNFRVPTRSRFD